MNPKIICNIVLSIALIIILIVNNKLKNKTLKILFLLFSLIYLVLIILTDNNFVYDFLKAVISYIWYPSYLLFIITVIFSIVIFIISFLKRNNITFKGKSYILKKYSNYCLFIICFLCYNIFQTLEIDSSLYTSLYSGSGIILMRIVNISFILWLIFNIILKYRGRNEK